MLGATRAFDAFPVLAAGCGFVDGDDAGPDSLVLLRRQTSSHGNHRGSVFFVRQNRGDDALVVGLKVVTKGRDQ